MKVCLLNPPLSVHEFPHLALPLLKGYLQGRGIECITKDFNVEIMDQIIDEGMEKVQNYFYDRDMKISLVDVRRRFHDARQVFWTKDSFTKGERAQKLINTYLRIAGSNIFDICFKPDSLNAILKGYQNLDFEHDENKIIRYIRQDILPFVKKCDSKVVGISVPFTSQIFYALVLGREIKKMMPECKVVLGGPQISLFWKILTNHKEFRDSYDGLLCGMGELSLEAYIKAVYNNQKFDDVPNLVYFNEANELIVNKENKVGSMLEIPLPDFSDLPLEKYIYAKLPYQMSRGCYWSRCAFCSYRNNKGYITKEVEQVADDFSLLEKKYGIHIFQFIDDAIRPDILSKFAETILQRNMKIRYDAYLRLDRGFTYEVCQLLGKSGLKNVLFGFESANQRMLNLMNKGNTPENMLSVLKNMKSAGIQSILSCLIGFPTETREEAWDSIRYLKEYREWYYWVYIVHFGLISDMCNSADTYGLYDIDYNNLIRYDDTGFTALGYPYKTSVGMTVEQALDVIKEGREHLGIKIFDDNFFS